jgi:diguanylate cyclase (GGDEF)-like protein
VRLRGERHDGRAALAVAEERIRHLEAELRDRVRVDAGSGLLTLDAFRDDAAAMLELTERAALPVSLVMVDIDGCRALNARRGSAAGNAALTVVATRLREHAGESDILGRTGADDIAVLMPGTPPAEAKVACERLIAEVEGIDIPLAGFITISAGVAGHQTGMTIDSLLAAAAHGLNRARAEGGARAASRPTPKELLDPFRTQTHVISALATALLERDRYTGEHSEFVVDMARTVAAALGLDPIEVERVRHASRLHDIGKVAIPDHILNKPGPLTDDEWELMREHPAIGERILRAIPGMGGVARIVRHEHERFDGGGYPDGLRGDTIPIGSRIILACDAYHAMTSNRPYRCGLSHAEAVAELVRCSGSQFDPKVVAALVGHLGRRAGGEQVDQVTARATG